MRIREPFHWNERNESRRLRYCPTTLTRPSGWRATSSGVRAEVIPPRNAGRRPALDGARDDRLQQGSVVACRSDDNNPARRNRAGKGRRPGHIGARGQFGLEPERWTQGGSHGGSDECRADPEPGVQRNANAGTEQRPLGAGRPGQAGELAIAATMTTPTKANPCLAPKCPSIIARVTMCPQNVTCLNCPSSRTRA